MTTLEEMAIAVLRGDIATARALADSLREEHSEGMMELPPVTKLKCDVGKLRIVLFAGPDAIFNTERTEQAVKDWISGKNAALLLTGVTKIELYEMP